MNTMMLVALAVVAGGSGAQGDPVTVCVEGGTDLPIVSLAEGVTSRDLPQLASRSAGNC